MDGLSKREETPTEMTEHFVNRTDFLYYRHVVFGIRQKKVAPATAEGPPRPILVGVSLPNNAQSCCLLNAVAFQTLTNIDAKTFRYDIHSNTLFIWNLCL